MIGYRKLPMSPGFPRTWERGDYTRPLRVLSNHSGRGLGILVSTRGRVFDMDRRGYKKQARRRLSPFVGVSSFQVLAMFRRGLFYTFLSVYLRFYLGLTVTETTFFATFPMIVNVTFQTFVWGRISDKTQKRRTLIILGELFAAVSTFFVWVVHRMPEGHHAAGFVVIAGMSFVEVFWSMSNVGWSALISDLYPKGERTGVQGKLASIGAAGRFVGVWIGGLAYDGLGRYYEGWGFHEGLLFFVASGVMVVSTIPMFFVPEGGVHPRERELTRQEAGTVEADGVAAYSSKFVVFLLALLLINLGRNSITMIKAQYLVLPDGFHASSDLLGYIVNMQTGAILLGGLVIGRISRRFSDETLTLTGSVIAAVSLLGFFAARRLGTVFASNFLTGIGDVVILAASYSYAARLIPALYRGRQFALFHATMFLSWGAAGTLMAGPLVDWLIGRGRGEDFAYRMSFLAASAMVAIGIVVLVLVNRMKDPSHTR
jgi:MFS family permease